uniref:Uncharacterized protein n=1 Tax=Rhizophora mucronata TaxID=61149 RepID=A0A2P2KEQ5_RHIMU
MACNWVLHRCCSWLAYERGCLSPTTVHRIRRSKSIGLAARNCSFSSSNIDKNDKKKKKAAVVVADGEKVGNKPKEIISITPCLYQYVLSNIREPEVPTFGLVSNVFVGYNVVLSFAFVISDFAATARGDGQFER